MTWRRRVSLAVWKPPGQQEVDMSSDDDDAALLLFNNNNNCSANLFNGRGVLGGNLVLKFENPCLGIF